MRPPAILLGLRARVFTYAAAGVSLIFGVPQFQGKLVEFLLTPPGLSVIAVGLIALGISIEQSGTLARARVGIGVRLAAPALLAAAAVRAAAIGSTHVGGWTAFAAFSAPIALVTAYDARLFGDLRHGQATRLETIARGALEITAEGEPILVPIDAIVGVTVGESSVGRAVLVHVAQKNLIHGDASRLPWIGATADRDIFALTEHQCNRDARAVMGEIAANAANGPGYRGAALPKAPGGGHHEA
jgi:hypothetical protein